MTAEEKRKWIDILMDKTMKVHEQKKHYVNMSSYKRYSRHDCFNLCNKKQGLEKDGDAGFYKSCLMDLFPKELPEMIESLDSLLKNEEAISGMIGVSRYRDPVGIKLMRRAGLNPDQYIAVKNNTEELVAMNIKTGEEVRIEKVPVRQAIRDSIKKQVQYRAYERKKQVNHKKEICKYTSENVREIFGI